VQKHLHSLWTTTLQQCLKEDDRPLFESYLPDHIGTYFTDTDWLDTNEPDTLYSFETCSEALKTLLERYRPVLSDTLKKFLNQFNVEDLRGLSAGIPDLETFFFREMPRELNRVVNHLRKKYLSLRKKRREIIAEGNRDSEYKKTTAILKALKELSLMNDTTDFYTLSVLSKYGFFPGYSLQKGGVEMINLEQRDIIEIERPYSLALREFAPPSSIYALGTRFTPRKYNRDVVKDFIGQDEKYRVGEENISSAIDRTIGYDEPGEDAIPSIHLCDGLLERSGGIGDEENQRLIVSYDIRGMVREEHLGGKQRDMGERKLLFCRKDRITLVNTGSNKNITKKGYGFLICPDDGVIFSETELGHQRFLEHMNKIHGITIRGEQMRGYRQLLHAHFISDWLSFGPFFTRREARNWMESFRMGMTFVLESGKDSWDSFIRTNGTTYEPLFFETVPGGTGMLELAFDAFNDISARTLEQLETCTCKNSCYRCLRTYWNQGFHSELDRNTAIDILNGIQNSRHGEVIEIPAKRSYDEPVQVKETESYAENRFEQLLLSYRFPQPTRQYEVTASGTRTRADFAYPLQKVLIYIDGAAYHTNRKALDKRQEVLLEQAGYTVFHIHAKELEDPVIVEYYMKKIVDALKKG
jgi:very-short-patch-repair endonuclease